MRPVQVLDILDNGGRTADRYTVRFRNGDYLGLSENPTHPQGVAVSGTGHAIRGDDDEQIPWADLPQKCKLYVLQWLSS